MSRRPWLAGQAGWLPVLSLALSLAAAVPSVPVSAGAGEETQGSEALIRAGFVLKFPLFVTWPDESWRQRPDSVVVTVLGETPMLEALRDVARHSRIENRPVCIRHAAVPDSALGSQIVVIGESEAQHVESILARLRGRSILTVAASRGLAKRGVLVNFIRVGDQVRFELNPAAARENGFQFSFRLTSVAKMVGQP